MKLGTYPQGNKALNSLTPKPNWIPSLNPPGVQPSADRCIFLCPGSTRPDNWFKTFWISNNWTLKTKGNLYTTSLNNQQTQLRISQTMNNMYRIQQNSYCKHWNIRVLWLRALWSFWNLSSPEPEQQLMTPSTSSWLDKSATIIESSLASWRRRLPALQCSLFIHIPIRLSVLEVQGTAWVWLGQRCDWGW